MKRLYISLILFVLFWGCQKEPELYCSEGLLMPDGLHVYYSVLPNAEGAVVPFDGDQRNEFYVVLLSKCSGGFCVEDYEKGELVFTGDSHILENGCHTREEGQL